MLPALLAATIAPSSSLAQVGGSPIEISAGAGVFKYDIRSFKQGGPAFVGSLGWRPIWWLAFEGNAAFGPAKSDTAELDHNFAYGGLDLRWNFRPPESRAVPFLITGMGYGRASTLGHPPDVLERGAPSFGGGVLINAFDPRTYLRLQARQILFRERDSKEFGSNFAATVGVHYVLLGKYRDQDLDGVRDWLDKCPDTPIGATVDAHGCASDTDQDSVFAGIDKCPDTPRGCEVDATGCSIDADGDSVCNGLDQCADTPRGCRVSATGCPGDADGDGVCDGVDRCDNTPKGCVVDSSGCTQDQDGDGVCDALDQCLGTPRGAAVNDSGCPTVIGEFERTLLSAGQVRIKGIVFEADGKSVAAASHAQLDEIAAVFAQYPSLKVEIGGPTDVTGKQAVSERLSLDQAKAVYEYIKSQQPTITGGNFTFRGYPAQADAAPPPEKTRLKGRRVEFKVLNPEVLPPERAKRGL
jgi:outer membrane protein OmpA-like peptidoglycan-associated protein